MEVPGRNLGQVAHTTDAPFAIQAIHTAAVWTEFAGRQHRPCCFDTAGQLASSVESQIGRCAHNCCHYRLERRCRQPDTISMSCPGSELGSVLCSQAASRDGGACRKVRRALLSHAGIRCALLRSGGERARCRTNSPLTVNEKCAIMSKLAVERSYSGSFRANHVHSALLPRVNGPRHMGQHIIPGHAPPGGSGGGGDFSMLKGL